MKALTEAAVTDLLRQRHTKRGNGGAGEFAFMEQVRNGAGFDVSRVFDAVAVDLWPSRGLGIHVYEVKVSRSDWLRELRSPHKATDACRLADYFWIAAPAGCVRADELPDGWGLLEVRGDGTEADPWRLRHVRAAAVLHHDDTRDRPLSRSFFVGLIRAVPGAVLGGKREAVA